MVQTAKQFYRSIKNIDLIDTCTSCDIKTWHEYMKGTKKASYKEIHRIIRKSFPQFIDITMDNPYQCQYRRKEGLIVMVHSAIEYFFKIN